MFKLKKIVKRKRKRIRNRGRQHPESRAKAQGEVIRSRVRCLCRILERLIN